MTKLWLVARHEYRRNVFKKSFILALLSLPLMIALNVGVGLFIESTENNDAPVGYVDHADLLADPIPAPAAGSREPIALIPFQTEDDARAALESEDIQAYYVLAAGYSESGRVDLYYLQEPGRNATPQFRDFIQINLLADQPIEIARQATSSTSVIVRSLDGDRQAPGGRPTTFRLVMPLLISLAFLVLLVMNSGYLVQAVADEKENRTMEVLLTSLAPRQLIGGKVLGIVAIGLTQLVVWAAVGALGVIIAGNAGIEWFQNPSLDLGTILATVAIAIPSYVLACALMVAIGATVVSAQEGQSIGAIFFILHVVPIYILGVIVGTPNGTLPTVLSFLPFTALMTVSLRNWFTAVPAWQILVSVAVQTASAAGAILIASSAFRQGMLRYGRRLNLREIFGRANHVRGES